MTDTLSLLNSDNYGVYNRLVAKLVGLKAAVLLAELISKRAYHARNNELVNHHRYGENLFYHTVDAVEERLSLSRDEQEGALKRLKRLGLVSTCVFGLPGKRYFALHDEKILGLLGLAPIPSEIDFVPECGEDPNGFNPDDLPPPPTLDPPSSTYIKEKPQVVDNQDFLCPDLKNVILPAGEIQGYYEENPCHLPLPLMKENKENKEEKSGARQAAPPQGAGAPGPVPQAAPLPSCGLKPLSKTNVSEIKPTQLYGSHVSLEPREYEALSTFMGDKVLRELIDQMNDYCQALKPRGYKSYAAALRMWHRRKQEKPSEYHPSYRPHRQEVISEHERIRQAQYQRWIDANGDPNEGSNVLRFD